MMSQPSTQQLPTRRTVPTSGAATTNSVKALQGFGQSVWLDYLHRGLFASGEFERLIVEDGLRGVTSNPAIFEKAIAGGTDYTGAIQELDQHQPMEPLALYATPPTYSVPCTTRLLEPTAMPASRSRRISRTIRPPPSMRPAASGEPSIGTTS